MPCSEIGTIVSRLAINQTTWRTEIALIRKKWSASHAREKFFRRNTRYEIRPTKACSESSILLKSVQHVRHLGRRSSRHLLRDMHSGYHRWGSTRSWSQRIHDANDFARIIRACRRVGSTLAEFRLMVVDWLVVFVFSDHIVGLPFRVEELFEFPVGTRGVFRIVGF